MTYRVIQWSTGHVGELALHGIISHPGLELVGLWVHSEAKAGRDAGELCGMPPTGVLATNDADALLEMDADCVSYTATADLRPWEAVQDLCRILESGKNVVSSSLVQLLHPRTADRAMIERLEASCRAGGVSLFTNGIDPGFCNDFLPSMLTGVVERVDTIRVSEILNYDTYDQPEVLFETMGFGKPLDHTPLLLFPGALSYAWGGAVHTIAEAVGVDVEEIRERHEKAALDRDVVLPYGTVEAGTMAGLRFEVIGVVGGREAIVIEHVTRVDDSAGPDWPSQGFGVRGPGAPGVQGKGHYRVELTGAPTIRMDVEFEGEDGDHNTGGVQVTAMKILNAIPAVCAAPPGVLSTLDVGLVTGKGLMPA